jgi:hypothetical protein
VWSTGRSPRAISPGYRVSVNAGRAGPGRSWPPQRPAIFDSGSATSMSVQTSCARNSCTAQRPTTVDTSAPTSEARNPRNPGLCPDRGKDPLTNFAGPGLRRRVPFFASPAFTKPQVSGTAVTARGESSPARSANVARTGEGADCGATPALPLCGSTRQGRPSLRVAAPTRGGQPILNQRAVPYRELLFRYTNSTLGADRGGHIGGAAARERP